jgi:DNA-directed RNA polymerase subunit RPC12/RpoP
VPTPSIFFCCPSCRSEFSAPAMIRSEVVNCPDCDTDVIVPWNPGTPKSGRKEPSKRNFLFQCPACSHGLAVGDVKIGESVVCPSCSKDVKVPEPGIFLACPTCNFRLLAAKNLAGLKASCSNCKSDVILPKEEPAPAVEPAKREGPEGVKKRVKPSGGGRKIIVTVPRKAKHPLSIISPEGQGSSPESL